ncbi:dipeptidase 2 [Ascobolus immersus RN42]|uniref:Dipeptidase n=1 Tax=Ascobolus immersus RN42 TaxID=1160509 RepID=A0A3N4ISG0_ASCIM|nr:dipeptidase 2 [Ascobolus immersus RN42]
MDRSKREDEPLLSSSSARETPQAERSSIKSAKRRRYRFNSRQCCVVVLLIVTAGSLMSWIALSLNIYHSKEKAVFRKAPLVDGHNDWPIWIRAYHGNHLYDGNITTTTPLPGHVDFPRLRKGRLSAQFWSAYVPCPADSTNHSDPNYFLPVHDTLQQIDLIHRLITAFPTHLVAGKTSHSAWSNFGYGFHPRRITSYIGIEGLHQIGNSISTLRTYHALGVRYATLTHNCNNIFADAAISPEGPIHNGLSPIGKKLIHEMNRMGMMVDLSHTSQDTMRDALAVSKAPVIFSHSCAYAVCNHPRNVPDDVLDLLKDNGGVVMVTFLPDFVKCGNSSAATIEDVADHIVYIGERIGYRHVGLGSDFDGMPKGPEGLEDVSKYPDLVRVLLKRGLGVMEAAGVIGGNVLRVMAEVEGVGRELVMTGHRPLEDEVERGW